MWYNYIRFESVFEFGSNYQLTVANMKGAGSLSPFGKILKFFICLYCYLIPSFNTRLSFPFIYLRSINILLAYKGYIFIGIGMGILLLPITWFIFGIGAIKKFISKQTDGIMHNLIIALTCLGFLQIAVVGSYGIHYQLDLLWLFIFAGLFYAYFVYEKITGCRFVKIKTTKFFFNLNGLLRNLIILSMIISIILVFIVTFSSSSYALIMYYNPSAIYFIQRLLGLNSL
jgi:hypothetical protein